MIDELVSPKYYINYLRRISDRIMLPAPYSHPNSYKCVYLLKAQTN